MTTQLCEYSYVGDYFNTSCNQTAIVDDVKDDGWKFCPYCGAKIIIKEEA
jgi:DNA-directed RNA polymerase subunit RPC12/RpoP